MKYIVAFWNKIRNSVTGTITYDKGGDFIEEEEEALDTWDPWESLSSDFRYR